MLFLMHVQDADNSPSLSFVSILLVNVFLFFHPQMRPCTYFVRNDFSSGPPLIIFI